jgi:hypothetical protein
MDKLHNPAVDIGGIIVNREVEIRQAERTDIHVDATTQEAGAYRYDKATVIIETKGCWNRELNEAMKTQLVDRYLNNHPSPYGLYLIGWFICDRWDNSDDRKRDARRLTRSLEDSEERFNQQARNLSQQGIQVLTLILNTTLPDERPE